PETWGRISGQYRAARYGAARRDARRGEWPGFAGPEGAGRPPLRSIAAASASSGAVAARRALAVGADVFVGRGLVRIVVEHHDLIGEELLLRRADGLLAAAGAEGQGRCCQGDRDEERAHGERLHGQKKIASPPEYSWPLLAWFSLNSDQLRASSRSVI